MKSLGIIATLLLFSHIGFGQILVESKKMYSTLDSTREVQQRQRVQPETLFNGQANFVAMSPSLLDIQNSMAMQLFRLVDV